jgi:hypothetical protein
MSTHQTSTEKNLIKEDKVLPESALSAMTTGAPVGLADLAETQVADPLARPYLQVLEGSHTRFREMSSLNVMLIS